MNISHPRLFAVIALMMIIISCGDRDVTGPDDGIAIFDLSVTSSGLKVILSWDKIDDSSLTGYTIYRQIDDGDFVKYNSVSSEAISFNDESVSADIQYAYWITAMLSGDKESEPSETVQVIPGLTTTWVLDNSTGVLSELTHDVAHTTGKFFNGLPDVVAFDIDKKNGYLYLLDRFNKTLMLYVEGQEPGTFTNSDSTFTTFENPSDLDFDSVRDDMWIADGSSGNIYHFSELEPGRWVRKDSLNTGGSADEGHIDTNNGDYWVVNRSGRSVVIFQNLDSEPNRKIIGGFSTGGIILALDDRRARAYVVDVGAGTVSKITATGVKTDISDVGRVISVAVDPESGDLWLLADENGDGSYDLIKLSVVGSRILEIDTGLSEPSWMGVNSDNMNVVVLNRALDEPRVATFDKFGISINTFDGLNSPDRARIFKLD